jgi:hypothetical protein
LVLQESKDAAFERCGKGYVSLEEIKERYTDSNYQIGETRVNSTLHGAKAVIDGGRRRKV